MRWQAKLSDLILQGSQRRFDPSRFSRFLDLLQRTSPPLREQADKAFQPLKASPQHPSLHFKKVGRFWSARVGLRYRVVGVEAPDGIV